MRIDQLVRDRDYTIQQILKALRNQLNAVDNFQAKILTLTTHAVANTEFTVNHNLGVKPTFYIWNVDTDAIVYDSRRSSWTNSQMFLKCSKASVGLTLVVMI